MTKEKAHYTTGRFSLPLVLNIIILLFIQIPGYCSLTLHCQDLRRNPVNYKQNDTTDFYLINGFSKVEIKSPVDGRIQKAYFYRSTGDVPAPLVVQLHSWTYDYRQYDSISIWSREKNVNYIHPDFRGANRNFEACCSDLALSDMDEAIDFAIEQGNVDTSAIYVLGQSGGGYATLALFMKSRHRIRKFSAWVPISDLTAWYEETRIRKLYYAGDILECTGSANGILNKAEADKRSPVKWKAPVDKLKYCSLEIFAGVYDGLEGNGPIPITHSINFYNKIMRDMKVRNRKNYVSDDEKLSLLEFRKPLGNFGTIGGREICHKKSSGNVSLTIFTGKHEMLTEYAFESLFK